MITSTRGICCFFTRALNSNAGPHNDDGAPTEVDAEIDTEQVELDRNYAGLDETYTPGTHNRSLGKYSDDLGNCGPEEDLQQNMAINREDEPELVGLASTETALEQYSAPNIHKPLRIGKAKKISAYFTFANQNREAVKAEMVAAGKATIASEIAKILGERWRSLTDTEKQLYTTGSDDLSKKLEARVSQKHMKGKGVVEEDPEYSDTLPDQVEGDSIAPEFVAPFPISRVKRIIKLDQDIRLVASDGIVLITQAAALFVEMLASASFSVMVQHKRKSVRSQDVLLAAKSKRQVTATHPRFNIVGIAQIMLSFFFSSCSLSSWTVSHQDSFLFNCSQNAFQHLHMLNIPPYHHG